MLVMASEVKCNVNNTLWAVFYIPVCIRTWLCHTLQAVLYLQNESVIWIKCSTSARLSLDFLRVHFNNFSLACWFHCSLATSLLEDLREGLSSGRLVTSIDCYQQSHSRITSWFLFLLENLRSNLWKPNICCNFI